MKNEFENSDKRLQEKLEGFRMAAPEGAWAGIEGNIGGKTGGRGGFFYVWIALIFTGVTGAGIFTFLYLNNDNEVNAAKTSLVVSNETSDNHQKESNINKQKNTSYKTSQNSGNTQENSASKLNASVAITRSQNSTSASVQSTSAGNANSSSQQQAKSNASNSSASNTTDTSRNTSNTSSQSQSAASNSSTNTSSSSTPNNGLNNAASNSATSSSSNQSANNTVSNNKSSTTSNNSTSETSNETSTENSSSPNKEDNSTIAENKTLETKTNSESSENPAALNAENNDTTTIASIPTSKESDPLNIERIPPKKEPEIKVRPNWSLEAGLDLSSVNFNHTAANNAGLQQSLNASYSQNFAQAAFLRVNYKPFQRFSFHSGLEYAQNKATQDYTWITTTSTFQYDTTGWYFDTIIQQQLPIIDTIETTSQEENLTQFKNVVSQVYIPLGVMFHVPLGTRSELGINATGLVGIRTGSKGEILVDENGNSIAVTEAYRSVNFSARTALRYTYFISGKSAVYLEPYVGFGLNDRSNTTLPFGTRFRNSGIRVGFRYSF